MIDAHVHLWDTTAFDLPWLSRAPWLVGAYTPADLRAAAEFAPHAVAVQAGSDLVEAEWLAETADAAGEDVISRVVLAYSYAADTWAGMVTSAFEAASPSVAGIRLVLRQEPDDWIRMPGLEPLLGGLERRGGVLELLLRPGQLATVAIVAQRHPSLRIVLCHCGLSTGEPDRLWRDGIARLSRLDSISAKVSGLFAADVPRSADDARVKVAVDTMLSTFGTRRLMFGSDWPMSTLVGGYGEILERTAAALGHLTADQERDVWSDTASREYGILQRARCGPDGGAQA